MWSVARSSLHRLDSQEVGQNSEVRTEKRSKVRSSLLF